MYPVQLTGQRVLLREFEIEDVDQAFAIVGDRSVTTWLSFDARTRDETDSMVRGIIDRAHAELRTEYYLAITLPTGAVVGFIRLGLDGVQAGKLGYAIRTDQWRHGYATDAAIAMLDFGFHTLRLHRISAAIGPDNAASIAVINRLRFSHEGRIRDHVHTNGAWRDSLLYSLLDHEWSARNPASDTIKVGASP
jgi:RimJ/RimL family protein N-acetyltransferase